METIINKPISILTRRYNGLLIHLLALYSHCSAFIDECRRLQRDNDWDSFLTVHHDGTAPFTTKALVKGVLTSIPLVNNCIFDYHLLREHYIRYREVGLPAASRRRVVKKLKRLYRVVDGIALIFHRLRYTLPICHSLSEDNELFPLMRDYRRCINCLTHFSMAQARRKYQKFLHEMHIDVKEDDTFDGRVPLLSGREIIECIEQANTLANSYVNYWQLTGTTPTALFHDDR